MKDFKAKLKAEGGLANVTIELGHCEYPDYVEGWATAADWRDSLKPLTEDELDELNGSPNEEMNERIADAAQDRWSSEADAAYDAWKEGGGDEN